jgi:hypothetical protein
MKNTNSSPTASRSALVPSLVGLLALACASVRAADPPSPEPPTYTWSAELVAFDKGANTVTVKSRLVSDAPDIQGLKPGDAAMLTWSGISTAAGVRAIEKGSKSSYDHMSMPVEFVKEEGRYVSFKVPIPAKGASALANIKPGNYVTATSPQHPKSAKEAVSDIRAYTDVH